MTEPFDTPQAPPPRRPRLSRAQATIIAIVLALAAGKLIYVFLYRHRLEQTAALFIGLPAILAVLLAMTPNAKSPIGITMKGITLTLLLSGVVFGEGFVCILMAAPLAYAVGLIAALIVTIAKKRRAPTATTLSIALLPFAPMALEGVTSDLSFARREVVTAERVVELTPGEFALAAARKPAFNRELPLFLQLGFPRPVGAEGSGGQIGDIRTIQFAGGEGRPGTLSMVIRDQGTNHLTFVAVSDTSHIAHWMDWRSSVVAWRSEPDGRTRVRVTMTYDRRLDPAWYFGPLERATVELAAGYLIEALASP